MAPPKLLTPNLAAQIHRQMRDYVNTVGATIYNRYTSSGAEAWQRTQITVDAWMNKKAANVIASGGNMQSDSAVIYISLPRDASDIYLEPLAWQANKTGKWTLQDGDYIVKGSVTDTIGPSFTLAQLKAKYDNVLRISSVDTLDDGQASSPHYWKVSAK
jgi:hypothetical protein